MIISLYNLLNIVTKMKKIILIFLLIINSNSFAAEFKLDTSGSAEIEGITFNDSSKFSLYKSKGYWKASSGDYGTVKCFGTLKNNKDNSVEFEVYCKHISQDKQHFVMKFLRGTGTEDSGIGKAKITETSKKFDYLLNLECNHAITYIEKDYFAIQKCKY